MVVYVVVEEVEARREASSLTLALRVPERVRATAMESGSLRLDGEGGLETTFDSWRASSLAAIASEVGNIGV